MRRTFVAEAANPCGWRAHEGLGVGARGAYEHRNRERRSTTVGAPGPEGAWMSRPLACVAGRRAQQRPLDTTALTWAIGRIVRTKQPLPTHIAEALGIFDLKFHLCRLAVDRWHVRRRRDRPILCIAGQRLDVGGGRE